MWVKYEFTTHVVNFDEHLSLHGNPFSHGAEGKSLDDEVKGDERKAVLHVIYSYFPRYTGERETFLKYSLSRVSVIQILARATKMNENRYRTEENMETSHNKRIEQKNL